MTKKWTLVRIGAWCVAAVAVLSECHAAKSRDAEFVPFPQRVSIGEHTSRQLLEISNIAMQVVAETGGELTVMGLPCIQMCGSDDTQGYQVVDYTTVAPSMSFKRLEKLVTENKPDWAVTVQVDKENNKDATRGIRLIDNYGGLAKFKFSEDSTTVRSRSACLSTDEPLDDPGQFILPSVEKTFPGVRVAVSDNTNPDPYPLPTFTPGVHAAPQSGAQSGAQSRE